MNAKMHRILVGAAGMLLVAIGWASPAANRGNRVESSMVIDGRIDINPDGSVAGYELSHPEKVPPSVAGLVARAIPGWRFAPVMVDGAAVLARADMHLRLVAVEREDGRFEIGIRNASFGGSQDASKGWVEAKSMPPPTYPKPAMRAGVTGTVYVVMRVGADGKVADATVERVNLKMVAREGIMRTARELLGEATLATLRKWTFTVHRGQDAESEPSWDVRVPVTFNMQGDRVAGYGEWESYVPGPYARAPWLEEDIDTTSDALAAGGIYPVGGGPQLLSGIEPTG